MLGDTLKQLVLCIAISGCVTACTTEYSLRRADKPPDERQWFQLFIGMFKLEQLGASIDDPKAKDFVNKELLTAGIQCTRGYTI